SNVVSRVHARLNYEMGVFTIEDLNSTNGTFVNEERLKSHEIKTIEKGDVIKLADLEFSVE
ncbi:MAG: FHA domain-containing protein, partial [Eubacterium sp.]|nr:FHA domain-containing protein [Eubacterium sp.]